MLSDEIMENPKLKQILQVVPLCTQRGTTNKRISNEVRLIKEDTCNKRISAPSKLMMCTVLYNTYTIVQYLLYCNSRTPLIVLYYRIVFIVVIFVIVQILLVVLISILYIGV